MTPVAMPLPVPSRESSLGVSFARIIEHANDVVVVTDADTGSIVYVNAAFTTLTGFTREQALGHSPGRLLQGPKTDPATVERIRSAIHRQEGIRTEILNYDTRGREYWLDINIVPLPDEQGRITHFAAIERDITSQRHAQEALTQLVGIDTLTGVANRRSFDTSLQREWQQSRRDGKPLALIAFDIDHFKRINDSHGHEAGDQVLRDVASRCTAALRPRDILARVGGEEFVVLLPHADLLHATQVAERLRLELAQAPVLANGVLIPVTASFGVTACEADDQAEGKQAVLRADRLMYSAKAAGRNRVHAADGDLRGQRGESP